MLSAAKHPYHRKCADAKRILRCAQNDKNVRMGIDRVATELAPSRREICEEKFVQKIRNKDSYQGTASAVPKKSEKFGGFSP